MHKDEIERQKRAIVIEKILYKDYTQESPDFSELLEIENLDLSDHDKKIFRNNKEGLTFEKILKLMKILMYKISLQNQKIDVRLEDFERGVQDQIDEQNQHIKYSIDTIEQKNVAKLYDIDLYMGQLKSAYKSIKDAEQIVRSWETNDLLAKLERKANKELDVGDRKL